MNFADDIERTIEKLNISTKEQTDECILEDAFAAFEISPKAGLTQSEKNIWHKLFKNKITQYAAVAALIIAGFAMFFKSLAPKPTASIRIDTALKKADNICISKFHADGTEPYEQVWSSKTMKVHLVKTTQNMQAQFALTDIPNKVKMLTYSPSDSVRREPVTEKILAELDKSMIQNTGLVTFLNSNEIIEEVHWQRVIDLATAARTPGTKTFDVTPLDEAAPGEAKYQKWRVLADTGTNLPKRAELYAKSELAGQYNLESYTFFSYPDDDEIKILIRNIFGPAGRSPDEPVYLGTPERN